MFDQSEWFKASFRHRKSGQDIVNLKVMLVDDGFLCENNSFIPSNDWAITNIVPLERVKIMGYQKSPLDVARTKRRQEMSIRLMHAKHQIEFARTNLQNAMMYATPQDETIIVEIDEGAGLVLDKLGENYAQEIRTAENNSD